MTDYRHGTVLPRETAGVSTVFVVRGGDGIEVYDIPPTDSSW